MMDITSIWKRVNQQAKDTHNANINVWNIYWEYLSIVIFLYSGWSNTECWIFYLLQWIYINWSRYTATITLNAGNSDHVFILIKYCSRYTWWSWHFMSASSSIYTSAAKLLRITEDADIYFENDFLSYLPYWSSSFLVKR